MAVYEADGFRCGRCRAVYRTEMEAEACCGVPPSDDIVYVCAHCEQVHGIQEAAARCYPECLHGGYRDLHRQVVLIDSDTFDEALRSLDLEPPVRILRETGINAGGVNG